MDRNIAPALQPISALDLREPQIFKIGENTEVHWISEVPNNTCRVELYFDAGTIKGERGRSSFASHLLLSGNEFLKSSDIHHRLDSLGAFHDIGLAAETSVVSLYALKDKMPKALNVLAEAIAKMSCEEKEVKEMVADRKQRFMVNLQKTKFLAQREFQKRLFQSNTAYAQVAEADYYEDVKREELIAFHQQNYLKGLYKIAVVGSFSKEQLNEMLVPVISFTATNLTPRAKELQNTPGRTHIEKKGALQTAIRVGRTLFNKNHPDFIDFQILNTILGDYFGSRLMSNIREDKGYTYGIGSMLAEYKNTGYFLIATEVGKEVAEATIEEIKFELQRLQTELVREEELSLVKNYLLGQMLKSADGPYNLMDLHLSVHSFGKDFSYYNEVLQHLHSITPERLRELAQMYFNWEELTVVSAG